MTGSAPSAAILALPRDGQPVAEYGGIVRAVVAVGFPAFAGVEGPGSAVVLHDPQPGRRGRQGSPCLDARAVQAGADALAEAAGIDVEAVQFAGDLRIR